MLVVTRQTMSKCAKEKLTGFHYPSQRTNVGLLRPCEHAYRHMYLHEYGPSALKRKKPPFLYVQNSLYVWDLHFLLIKGLNMVIQGWLNDFQQPQGKCSEKPEGKREHKQRVREVLADLQGACVGRGGGPRSRSERSVAIPFFSFNVLSDTCLGWSMSASFLLITSYYFTVFLGGTVFSLSLVGRHSGCFWLVVVGVADKVAIVILIRLGTGLCLSHRIPLCKLAKGVPPGRRGPGGTRLGKWSVCRLDSSPMRSSAWCPCAVNDLHICIWCSHLTHSILFPL